MREATPEPRVQVIGLGPGGLGIPVAADRLGRLEELLDLGAAFFDGQGSADELRRRNLAYVIDSNSEASDFLSPLSRTGCFSDLWSHPAVEALRSYGHAPAPLRLVSEMLALVAERMGQLCTAWPMSGLHFGEPVREVLLDGQGRFVTHGEDGRALARSRFLVLAMGAAERLEDGRQLGVADGALHLRSEELLREGGWRRLRECLDATPGARIILAGGSHSGFSCASVMLEHLGDRLSEGQVVLLHRDLALYSSGAAHRRRVLPTQPWLGERNRFRGLRGSARELYDAIASGQERRVCLEPMGDEASLRSRLSEAKIVVQALGYHPRRLTFRRSDGTTIDLGWERRRLSVDPSCRVLDGQRRAIPNLFGIGAGSCPLGIENELQVGVNLFHGPHAGTIVEQVLPIFRGKRAMSSSKQFSKAIGNLPETGAELDWTHQLKRGRVPGPRMEHNRLISDECGLSTKAVHAGTYVDPTTGAVGTPLFQTTTFLFSEHTYRSFAEGVTRDVPIYTRYGNPNQWAVQEKIASLEGAESAIVFASGMAAIATTLQALTNHGGHIVTSYDLYGGTYNLLREDLHQIGREVTFVDQTDVAAIEAAIRENTQVLFFETLTNPLLKPVDLVALGRIAEREQVLLVVDNTFLSPVCLRPLEHGVHVVLHSGTKYLNGHTDLTCGSASGSRKYVDRIWAQMLKSGSCLDPMSCFLLERGLKTLVLRMRAHHANAVALVEFLEAHPKIRRVHHPSAASYPFPWFRALCPEGFGGVLSFEIEGGDAAALRFLDQLTLPAAATSLGGVESLVSLPFNTSHSSLTASQREAVGILPGLVRFSVGIEDAGDLIADIDRALRHTSGERA